jgi:hypothetical protein
VRVVADHFSTLANESHTQFIVETPPSLPVQTDLDKLHRILLNLLSNAFKFTPAGGRVRVSLREAGPRFRLEVADSGPGIPADKREAVFERFEQLKLGGTRPRAGTGLGLSIVRDFAAMLGGNVSIGDAPERGALFVVDMPSAAPSRAAVRPMDGEHMNVREVEQLVDELHKPHPAISADRVVMEGSHGRVLVVEGNRGLVGLRRPGRVRQGRGGTPGPGVDRPDDARHERGGTGPPASSDAEVEFDVDRRADGGR